MIFDTQKYVQKQKSDIMSDAIIIALAVLSVQGHKSDEVSEREAFVLYDRGWIKDRTTRGLLTFTRKGKTEKSAKIYSRFEIESLKRAEKNIHLEYEKALEAVKKLEKLNNHENVSNKSR